MAGIDRQTMLPIGNFASALQGVEVIVSTRLYSRVMRRGFGGGVVEVLGRAMSPALMGLFAQLLATSIDLWEPRLRVRRVRFNGSLDAIRMGNASVAIDVDWRPGALLGDFRVDGTRSFRLLVGERVETLAT